MTQTRAAKAWSVLEPVWGRGGSGSGRAAHPRACFPVLCDAVVTFGWLRACSVCPRPGVPRERQAPLRGAQVCSCRCQCGGTGFSEPLPQRPTCLWGCRKQDMSWACEPTPPPPRPSLVALTKCVQWLLSRVCGGPPQLGVETPVTARVRDTPAPTRHRLKQA